MEVATKNFVVELAREKSLEDDEKNAYPFLLVSSVLSSSTRNMNNFIRPIDGFKSNDVYYHDSVSLFIGNKHWDDFKKARLFVKKCLQGRKDCRIDCGIFFGLFLAP